jgi:hypothetical protein
MLSKGNPGWALGVCIVVSAAGYVLLGYGVKRYETSMLIGAFALLFAIYLLLIRLAAQLPLVVGLAAAVGLRLTLFFSWPTLSDDFYRFVWDGRLWVQGFHPFQFLPAQMLGQHLPGLDQALYEKLNSPKYFTIYPPLPQFLFWLSAKLSPQSLFGSVLILRTCVVIAEVVTLQMLARLMQRHHLRSSAVYVYAFNPLVILELTGNLHMETFSICFLVVTFWYLSTTRLAHAGVALALAIASKLVPLLAGAAILRFLGVRSFLSWAAVVAFALTALFLPVLAGLEAWQESLALYYNKFEFNASLYYLVRAWGWWKYGYNIIQTAGWKLAAFAGILILLISFFRFRAKQNDFAFLAMALVLAFSIQLFFATTVHPWYITPLVAMCVLTPFRFPVFWSGLVFLSYAGYTMPGYQEPAWLPIVEYVIVYGYLGFELWQNRSALFRS